MGKKRVLVCGATGFIGRNIVENLAGNPEYEVVGTFYQSEPWEHCGAEMVRVDLTDPEQIDEVIRGADILIQAAATTSGSKDIVTKPYIHVTDNAVMNSLLFRAAFERGVKHVVFFSCTVMYHASPTALKETDFDANQELHKNYFGVGWTKVYIEKLCEFYSRIGDTRYSIIRHSNIYGPHDKFDLERSHVFGATMTKVMNAREGKIVVWGSGEEERDLVYVADLVDFVKLAIDRQEGACELFNVGSGKAVSINELVAKIIEQSGKAIAVEHDLSKPTIKTSLSLDCTKARQELGWEPRVVLEDGIQRTMEWYRENMGTVFAG